MGKKRAILKDHPHPAALWRAPDAVTGRQKAIQPDRSGVGPLQPGDQTQRRRLATATRAQKRNQRSRRHFKGDPCDRSGRAPILLHDILQRDQWMGHGSIGSKRFLDRPVDPQAALQQGKQQQRRQ